MVIVKTPNWEEVLRQIPGRWVDNGVSDPLGWFLYPIIGLVCWLVRLLTVGRFCAWARTPRQFAIDLDYFARIHDYGYMPARLPGSAFHEVTKEQWDDVYADGLRSRHHYLIAKIHPRALSKAGWVAWRNNDRQMAAWGWRHYDDFMRDTHKEYTATITGKISDAPPVEANK